MISKKNSVLQGYGVRQSDEEAERWWLKAGEEKQKGEGGKEEGSVVRAQNTLGMLYSQQETLDLGKVRLSIGHEKQGQATCIAALESLRENIFTHPA